MIISRNDSELLRLFHWDLIKNLSENYEIYRKNNIDIMVSSSDLIITIYSNDVKEFCETAILKWYYDKYGMLRLLNLIYILYQR